MAVYIYVDTYIYMNTYFNSVKDLTYRNILWIFKKGLASMQYQKTNKLSRYYFLRCCCFCCVAAATAVSQVSSPPIHLDEEEETPTRCSEQSSSIHYASASPAASLEASLDGLGAEQFTTSFSLRVNCGLLCGCALVSTVMNKSWLLYCIIFSFLL